MENLIRETEGSLYSTFFFCLVLLKMKKVTKANIFLMAPKF